MKKLLLPFIATLTFAMSSNVLPKNFGECSSVSYFTPQNAPIALNDFFKVMKKYACSGQIIYIGIEDRIPGILKLKINNDSSNFLLKHTVIKGFKTAVYIDKHLKKGVLAVQLNKNYSLKLLFYGENYQPYLNLLKQLNLNKIQSSL